MELERRALNGDPRALAAELRALVPAPASVQATVAEIIADVRARGDQAVAEYTARFDGDAEPAESAAPAPGVLEALKRAAANIERVAQATLGEERTIAFDGHRVTVRELPVQRAAVYAPGGRHPYPSTVLMGVVTARVAGVNEIAVCTPPPVLPVMEAAASIAGACTVYAIGGAQAIGALAYGTESVKPVDVIVGPGNLYVQEAKRQVSDRVGIDSFAGPSDLFVIAAQGADPELVALDLLAQAEHGSGTLLIGASADAALLDGCAAQLIEAADTGARAVLVSCGGYEQALELAEAFAPEHLELVGPEAEGLADRVTRAGCVFIGAASGTAFGDYIAGSNHVLPTNGAARFASALSPADFRRRMSVVEIVEPDQLAQTGAALARAEGFELHARSMEARIRDNG
jgi:histidinol dehydrogenase